MNPKTKRMLETELLTTREVADLTGLTAVAIQKRVERGTVDFVLKGNTYLFWREDFVNSEDK